MNSAPCVAAVCCILSLVVACGSTERKGSGDAGASGSGGSSGSDGSSGTGSTLAGPDPFVGKSKMLGSRFDEANGCIDATDQLETGCTGEPVQGGYYCVERKSDGAKYWVISIDALVIDESAWALCSPGRETLPPPPCFAAMCEAAPVSLCTEAQTVQLYRCGGPESEWDEQCCKRQTCTGSSDCAENQQCVAVGTRVFWDCWPTPGDTCDCGGTNGGPDRMMCMPM